MRGMGDKCELHVNGVSVCVCAIPYCIPQQQEMHSSIHTHTHDRLQHEYTAMIEQPQWVMAYRRQGDCIDGTRPNVEVIEEVEGSMHTPTHVPVGVCPSLCVSPLRGAPYRACVGPNRV